jgi:hypothetical protein
LLDLLRRPVETLSFDEKTKFAYITREQLSRTMTLEDANGKLPKATPIEHFKLLEALELMAEETGHTIKPQPIAICESNVRRLQWKGSKESCPISNYLVERLVTKLELVNLSSFEGQSDAAGTMAIAMSYTDRGGIQIAFGHNVIICGNLNIWGDTIFGTTGKDRHSTDFMKGMERLRGWLQNAENIRKSYTERIHLLMGRKVNKKICDYVMGRLFINAVRANNGDKELLRR